MGNKFNYNIYELEASNFSLCGSEEIISFSLHIKRLTHDTLVLNDFFSLEFTEKIEREIFAIEYEKALVDVKIKSISTINFSSSNSDCLNVTAYIDFIKSKNMNTLRSKRILFYLPFVRLKNHASTTKTNKFSSQNFTELLVDSKIWKLSDGYLLEDKIPVPFDIALEKNIEPSDKETKELSDLISMMNESSRNGGALETIIQKNATILPNAFSIMEGIKLPTKGDFVFLETDSEVGLTAQLEQQADHICSLLSLGQGKMLAWNRIYSIEDNKIKFIKQISSCLISNPGELAKSSILQNDASLLARFIEKAYPIYEKNFHWWNKTIHWFIKGYKETFIEIQSMLFTMLLDRIYKQLFHCEHIRDDDKINENPHRVFYETKIKYIANILNSLNIDTKKINDEEVDDEEIKAAYIKNSRHELHHNGELPFIEDKEKTLLYLNKLKYFLTAILLLKLKYEGEFIIDGNKEIIPQVNILSN